MGIVFAIVMAVVGVIVAAVGGFAAWAITVWFPKKIIGIDIIAAAASASICWYVAYLATETVFLGWMIRMTQRLTEYQTLREGYAWTFAAITFIIAWISVHSLEAVDETQGQYDNSNNDDDDDQDLSGLLVPFKFFGKLTGASKAGATEFFRDRS